MPFKPWIICLTLCGSAFAQPDFRWQACLKFSERVYIQAETGHLKEAEAALIAALSPDSRERLGASCDWMIQQDLAVVMSRYGRLEETAAHAIRAIALLEGSSNNTSAERPHDNPELLRPLHMLSSARIQQGRLTEAREAFERMRRLSREAPLEDALFHGGAAALLDAEGKSADSEAEYLLAIPAWEKVGESSSDLAAALNGLGDLYIKTKRYSEADRVLTRALAIYAVATDSGPADHIRILNSQAVLYANLGQWSKAEDNLRSALALADGPLGFINPLTLEPLLSNYAQVLRATHQSKEARSVEARAATLRSPVTNAIVDISELRKGK